MAELELIDEQCIIDILQNQNIITIVGQGGSGKTRLAKQFAKIFSRQVRHVVVWFDANKSFKIKLILKKILLNDLKISEEEFKNLKSEQQVKKTRLSIKEDDSYNYLLVFDDIDERQLKKVRLFTDSMPKNLKIILTSRNQQLNLVNLNIEIPVKIIKLDNLNAQQIKQYLIGRTGGLMDKNSFERIYQELFINHLKGQSTPYHLDLIVTLLEQLINGNGVDKVDERKLCELIENAKKIQPVLNIMNGLTKYPFCKNILRVLSFLDSSKIAKKLLNLLIKDNSLDEGLEVLEKYSLIESFYESEKKYFMINRMTQETIINELEIGELDSFLTDISNTFTLELKKCDEKTKEGKDMFEIIYLHARKVIEVIKEKDLAHNKLELISVSRAITETFTLDYKYLLKLQQYLIDSYTSSSETEDEKLAEEYTILGRCYFINENKEKAKENYIKAYRIYRGIFQSQTGILDKNHGNFLCNLGLSFRLCGYTEEAKNVLLSVLFIYENDYQTEEPKNVENLKIHANLLNNLGLIHAEELNKTTAVNMFKKGLDILEKTRDTNSGPLKSSILNNLGLSYQVLGDHKHAIECFNEAEEIARNSHVNQRSYIACILNNLGLSYQKINQEMRAISYHDQALAIYQKVYQDQPNHLSIPDTYNHLGICHKNLGDYKKAESYFLKATSIYRNAECRDRELAMCLNNLGLLFSITLKFKKAISCFLESLELFMSDLISSSFKYYWVAVCWNNIGLLYSRIDFNQEATECFEQALSILEEHYQEKLGNSTYADILNNLGASYTALNNEKKAFESLERALELCEKNTQTHFAILSNLGNMHLNSNDLNKALEYFKKGLNIYKAYKSQNGDEDLALFFNDLGKLNTKMGNKRKAIKYFFKALNIYRRKHDENIPQLSIAVVLDNLGLWHQKFGDNKKAIDYHSQALNIFKKSFKFRLNHKLITETLLNLGSAYKNIFSSKEAILFYTQALNNILRGDLLSQLSESTADIIKNLGILHYTLGDFKTSIEYLNKALEIYQKLYKDEQSHPMVMEILRDLCNSYSNLCDGGEESLFYHEVIVFSRNMQENPSEELVATAFYKLGLCRQRSGTYDEALRNLLEALEICENSLHHNPNQRLVANTLFNLGSLYLNMGNYNQACAYLARALQMYRKLLKTLEEKYNSTKEDDALILPLD